MIYEVVQAQDADGVPHFCYHDPSTGLSFVWDGLALEIDVSQDGQPCGQIPLPVGTHSAARNPARWLAQFEVHCQIYIKEKSYEVALAGPRAGDPVRRGIPGREGQTAGTTGPGESAEGAEQAP